MDELSITDNTFGDKYKAQLYLDYNELLLHSSHDEKAIQEFFEKNPALVPGGNCVFGESGHAPYLDTLISQPSLNGLTERLPDFMWFAKDSMTFEPVLIEIEAPNKKLFNSNGSTSAYFTQARMQLIEWKSILEKPENILKFYDEYDIPLDLRKLRFRPTFILIYGRRSEFEGDSFLTQKRANLMGEQEKLMTYDRLELNPKVISAITSTVKNGKYYAKYVSPILQISEVFRSTYLKMIDLDKAINNSMYISLERKSFMKERIFSIVSSPQSSPKGKLGCISFNDLKFE